MTGNARKDHRVPLEGLVIHEPPFCAWCGGTCRCDDVFNDEGDPDGEVCECGLEHTEEELAANSCACCGGIIDV